MSGSVSVSDDMEEISLSDSISSSPRRGGDCGVGGGSSGVTNVALVARLRVVSGYGVEGVRRDVLPPLLWGIVGEGDDGRPTSETLVPITVDPCACVPRVRGHCMRRGALWFKRSKKSGNRPSGTVGNTRRTVTEREQAASCWREL